MCVLGGGQVCQQQEGPPYESGPAQSFFLRSFRSHFCSFAVRPWVSEEHLKTILIATEIIRDDLIS